MPRVASLRSSIVLLAVFGGTAYAGVPSSDPIDAADWQRLAATSPDAHALAQQAEVARRAGRLADAATLYENARQVAPTHVVPARGACRVALADRRDAEARTACQRAFMFGGSP